MDLDFLIPVLLVLISFISPLIKALSKKKEENNNQPQIHENMHANVDDNFININKHLNTNLSENISSKLFVNDNIRKQKIHDNMQEDNFFSTNEISSIENQAPKKENKFKSLLKNSDDVKSAVLLSEVLKCKF